jgi:hypothetical protein
VPVVRRDRAALLLAVSLLAACAHAPDVPPWLVLRVGAQARLAASNPLEPERTTVFPSADAAHAALRGPAIRHAAAGDVVTVTQIDGHVVDGAHAVAVSDARGPLGWVLAEANLRPVPPPGTLLIVGATAADGSAQELFSDQDDDDGQAFGATTHVTYEGFASDPGNAEYRVHVDDGPLAGYDGYVVESELQTPQTHAFRFVVAGD